MEIPLAFIASLDSLPNLDKKALLQCIEENRSETSVRLNAAKANDLLLDAPIAWSKRAYKLKTRPSFTADPNFHAGAYYVQESSSMILDSLLPVLFPEEKPKMSLDLCASPGGKSIILSDFIGDAGILCSNEIGKQRSDILCENLQKWGISNTIVTRADAKSYGELKEVFDLILIDAPCSGEGMFRKHPQTMSHWTKDNVQLCQNRQREILNAIWPALKPGGFLIYSTCTFNQAENEEQIAYLMQEHDALNLPLPENPKGVAPSAMEGISAYRFYPHLTIGEGLFISVVQKPGNPIKSRPRKGLLKISAASRKELEVFNSRIKIDKAYHWRNSWFTCSDDMFGLLSTFPEDIYPLVFGIELGQLKGKEYIPSAGLALQKQIELSEFPKIQVSKQQALSLLARETPLLNLKDRSWNLVTYGQNSLLWIKNNGGRYNVYYPKEWRIRGDLQQLGEN